MKTIDRFPKLTIEDFSLVKSNQASYASHLNLSFDLYGNPDLFLQMSRVIINLVDVSAKFAPDLIAPHQAEILNNIRRDLQRYLIKNDY